MAHGGARSNAGRKPGAATKLNQQARATALGGGETPLSFMLKRMRDEAVSMEDRFEAAKAAAPYVHAKLSSVEADIDVTGELTIASKEQRDAAVSAALRSADS